jgi:hypothetical protein
LYLQRALAHRVSLALPVPLDLLVLLVLPVLLANQCQLQI